MRIIIFGNGEIKDYQFVKNQINDGEDYIICCDGGVRHAFELGIAPDLILGDLDSANPELLEHYKKLNVTVEKYQAEKDFTDMELCVRRAVGLNAEEICIFGAIGSRLDHTMGNAHALLYALKHKIRAYLADENNKVCIIDKEIILNGKKGDIVSLIPLSSSVTGVKTENLYYPLDFETLEIGTSRGISNIFVSNEAKISIEDGYLFVIQAKD